MSIPIVYEPVNEGLRSLKDALKRMMALLKAIEEMLNELNIGEDQETMTGQTVQQPKKNWEEDHVQKFGWGPYHLKNSIVQIKEETVYSVQSSFQQRWELNKGPHPKNISPFPWCD